MNDQNEKGPYNAREPSLKMFIDPSHPESSTKNIDDMTHLHNGERLEPLSDSEIHQAYNIWLSTFRRHEVDWQWRTYKENRGCDWLKQARKGLNLSAETVAKVLKCTRQGVHALETAEECGTISLKNLARAAAAMNCEVRYSLRPINDKFISAIVWNQILPHALEDEWLRRCHPSQRIQKLAYTVGRLYKDQKFRKMMGWSRNS